eukprot:g10441.t1 g10441   contig4:1887757-1889478(-)
MEHSIRYAHAGSRESRQSYHSKVEHRWCSSNWLADVIGLGLSTWNSNSQSLLESVPDELTWGYPPGVPTPNPALLNGIQEPAVTWGYPPGVPTPNPLLLEGGDVPEAINWGYPPGVPTPNPLLLLGGRSESPTKRSVETGKTKSPTKNVDEGVLLKMPELPKNSGINVAPPPPPRPATPPPVLQLPNVELNDVDLGLAPPPPHELPGRAPPVAPPEPVPPAREYLELLRILTSTDRHHHKLTHSLIVDQMDSQYLAMAKVKATLAKLEAMSFQVVVAIAATATEAWLVARQTA